MHFQRVTAAVQCWFYRANVRIALAAAANEVRCYIYNVILLRFCSVFLYIFHDFFRMLFLCTLYFMFRFLLQRPRQLTAPQLLRLFAYLSTLVLFALAATLTVVSATEQVFFKL